MTMQWHHAARSGDADALRALLAQGAVVDRLDRHGQSALMLAARHGHVAAVQALVAAGAALDITAKYGLSALMLAVANGHDAVARALTAAGANRCLCGTGAPGFAGRTAAELAALQGLTDLARCLAVDPA